MNVDCTAVTEGDNKEVGEQDRNIVWMIVGAVGVALAVVGFVLCYSSRGFSSNVKGGLLVGTLVVTAQMTKLSSHQD
jgi:hypothetical protein